MRTPSSFFTSLKTKLAKAKNILIAGHLNPDFDSLGSSLGLYFLLKKLRKKVFLGTEFKEPIWSFFEAELPQLVGGFSSLPKIDLVILLDYGSKERVPPKVRRLIEREHPIVVSLDHHSHQSQFGDLVWLAPEFCSTAEMIYFLLKKLSWPITEKVAYYLLLGIVGDTGGFSYYPLTRSRLKMVEELTQTGEEFPYFLHLSRKWFKPEDLIEFGRFLTKVKIEKKLGLAYLTITASPERSYLASRLVAQLSLIEGVKISLLLSKQKNGWFKGELRGSRENTLDLAQLASNFGGGGHFNAAGFISRLSSAKIISTIKGLIRQGEKN